MCYSKSSGGESYFIKIGIKWFILEKNGAIFSIYNQSINGNRNSFSPHLICTITSGKIYIKSLLSSPINVANDPLIHPCGSAVEQKDVNGPWLANSSHNICCFIFE